MSNLSKNFVACLVLVLVITWANRPACAQCELSKLLASDGGLLDYFGFSVAIDGNVTIIGARGADKAYIFRYNGLNWIQERRLLGFASTDFGRDVAISGNTAVIGAYKEDDNGNNSGSAYIVRYNGSSWILEEKILASDGAASDYFGDPVSIDSNTVVIGADGDDDKGSGSGSAYIFRRDANGTSDPSDDFWVEQDKLLASDGEAGDMFGNSVVISGDIVVVGANGDDDNGSRSGSVYVFRRDDNGTPEDPSDDFWTQEQKLVASDGQAWAEFGIHVAISGDTVIVGTVASESAYVFRYNGSVWVREQKLVPSDGVFGSSVAVSGDIAMIQGDGPDGDFSGLVCIFRRDANGTPADSNDDFWIEERKLIASDGEAQDFFGTSIAISGDITIIGASGDDDNGDGAGAAYVFGPSEQTGDFDDDCGVDFGDYAIMGLAWLTEPGDPNWNPKCDISDPNDDIIDNNDLEVFTENWLEGK